MAPSVALLGEIARGVVESLPEGFRALCGDVRLRVEEFPDEEALRDVGAEGDPWSILGMHEALDPLGDAAPWAGGGSLVILYRRPILGAWIEEESSLAQVVRHVVVHEIGHHFGMSDEDMESIEEGADRAEESSSRGNRRKET